MFDISPSPFDVRLVAFRIPIRVHWSFWLLFLLLGWDPDHPEEMFIWVMCGFFSILVHELGHALTAEAFGWPTHILMFYAGGVAISERFHNNTPGRGLLVSIMGPAAGFFLLLDVIVLQYILAWNNIRLHPHVATAFEFLEEMNLFYSLFNLIPVLPMDGGHICTEICQMLRLRDPIGVSLKVGAVVSGLGAYYFLAVSQQQFAGMMLLMFCVQSVMALQSRR